MKASGVIGPKRNQVIEANPDTMFYDYTKLGSESIAPNHHLTYSSTGFGQIIDGEKVFFKDKSGKYDHNWATMRDRRLNKGENVAMAFSSKSGMPEFLLDEETGVKYKVWNGDDYDARFLDPKQPDGEGIPYMALDLDPDRVRQAAAAGDSVVFGDAARLQALMAAGLARASAVVVTYQEVAGAIKVLGHIREHAPQVPVIVRTQDDHDLEALRTAGATEVVPEAIEGSLMLASHALALVGVPMRRVIQIAQAQRDARYSLLRGYFHGDDDSSVDELEQERLASVTLPMGARAIGQPVSRLALHALDTRVVSLRRRSGQSVDAALDPLLEDGDTLVLSGKPEPLANATHKLLKG